MPVTPPEPDKQLLWFAPGRSVGAELKREEGDAGAEDPDWEPIKTEKTYEASPAGADGRLLVIQEDGGYSDGMMWLKQDDKFSEGPKLANGCSDGVRTLKREADDEDEDEVTDVSDEGTFFYKM